MFLEKDIPNSQRTKGVDEKIIDKADRETGEEKGESETGECGENRPNSEWLSVSFLS